MSMFVNDEYNGSWVVYHISETRCPEVHNTRSGEWFFEPCCIGPGKGVPVSVYSDGYPTQEKAVQAALDWGRVLSERRMQA